MMNFKGCHPVMHLARISFRPLLAAETPDDLSKIRLPLLVSPKLDGVRCVKIDGRALTRSLKPIPNDHIRNWIEKHAPDHVDGEIVMRDNWGAPFDDVSGFVRRKDGEPPFTFAVFDSIDARLFSERFDRVRSFKVCDELQIVPHDLVRTHAALLYRIEEHLQQGYEGTMLRDPDGHYKHGRSTLNEGILIKVKHFIDEDATVVGIEEELKNTNQAMTNALGRTERSTHREGMVGKGRVGKFLCVFDDGTEFAVGSGLTDQQRIDAWDKVENAIDQWRAQAADRPDLPVTVQWAKERSPFPRIKVKHQPPPGGRPAGKAPRCPIFIGFRED